MILNFLKTSFGKVKKSLAKTTNLLGSRLKTLFSGSIDEKMLDQLEQLFYEADLGVATTQELVAKVRELHRTNPSLEGEGYLAAIRQQLVAILKKTPSELALDFQAGHPQVILIVGVNGNGKTTSVAKLAKKFKDNDLKIIIAAADTFRAAAIEQLEIWSERIGVEIVKGASKSDPASVAFDAVTAAKAREANLIIIDTAGRLHTKIPLMQELEKIKRSCQKVISGSPHETLLVLDATTGQNAIDQAKTFHQFTPITGIILTKLDGTAKGGIAVSIQRQLAIPIKFIGVGEGIDDLEPFDAESFVQALFE